MKNQIIFLVSVFEWCPWWCWCLLLTGGILLSGIFLFLLWDRYDYEGRIQHLGRYDLAGRRVE